DLRQPQGRRAPGPADRPGAEAGLPPGPGRSGPLRGAGFRAFLPAADGWSGPRREHPGGGRLLPFASALAIERADTQISRPALRGSACISQMSQDVFEITKAASFDAAHYLPVGPDEHRYRRMHGHSFRVEATLRGIADAKDAWVADLGELEQALGAAAAGLDHSVLNEQPGLER